MIKWRVARAGTERRGLDDSGTAEAQRGGTTNAKAR